MKRILITGANGELGVATTLAYRQAGWSVAMVDLADTSTAPTSGDAIYIGGIDLRDPQAARHAFEQARAAFGGVDAVANLAGAFTWKPLSQDGLDAWSVLFDANLRTCANMCSAAIAGLDDGGAIVNVGAAAAERAGPGMGAYAASKAGVARLTESLAAELQGRIRVNAILPLMIDTPRNRADMPDADPAAWTHPAAIADVALFLTSKASRAINGALLSVTAAISY